MCLAILWHIDAMPEKARPQRLLLVDDHNLVRAGVRQMLQSLANEAEIEIVGETAEAREALRLVSELDADLLITDLSMPDMDGITLIRKAIRRKPDLKCVVLSMHTAQERVVASLRAGACGYIHKNASAEELLHALRSVRDGASYIHPSIAGKVVDSLRDMEASSGPLDVLTERQREILKLVAEGCSTREIADRLALSAKTVETHRAQLMDRLNIRNVPGLVRFAIRNGLVELHGD